MKLVWPTTTADETALGSKRSIAKSASGRQSGVFVLPTAMTEALSARSLGTFSTKRMRPWIGKFLGHSFNGYYKPLRPYYFVAPRGT